MQTSSPRHRRISILCNVLIGLGLLLVLNLLYNYIGFTVPFAIGDPENMSRAYGFPEGQMVPLAGRLYYLGITALAVLSGLVAIGIGLRLMLQFKRGAFFEPQTTRTIRNLGLALVTVFLMSLLFGNTSAWVVTLGRPDGGVPFVFRLNSYDMGYLLIGLLLALIGWVLGEALQMQEENKGFV